MGRKATSPTGLIDVKAMWSVVLPQQWHQFFVEIAPQYTWEMVSKDSIRGRCPYHDDSSPSFSLNFTKRMGKCFGCEKYVSDIVNLVAKLLDVDYASALVRLQSKFGLDAIIGDKASELGQYNAVQEMKKAAAIAFNELLLEVIRDKPSLLSYCNPAALYLTETRELPQKIMHRLPVGVFGKPLHVKPYIKDPYLWELYEGYFHKFNTTDFYGSIIYHYNDSPGTISRFKLKPLDRAMAAKLRDAGGDFYALQTSEQRVLFSKAGMPYVDDPYTSDVGLFGLHKYQHMLGRNDVNAYITEGEFDVLTVMAQQELSDTAHFMLLGNGGKGSTNVSFLQDFGVKTLWLVQDHPAASGDSWAQAILGDKRNFAPRPDGSVLRVRLFTWPKEFRGFDLDEAVRTCGYEDALRFLFIDRNSFFMNSLPWVIHACEQEIKSVHVERDKQIALLDEEDENYKVQLANTVDDDRRKANEILLKWFRYVHDPGDRTSFAQHFVASENVDINQFSEANIATYGLDTINGVVKYLEDTIKSEYFTVAYRNTQDGKPITYLYSRRAREIVAVPTSDTKFLEIMATYCGMSVVNWLDAMVPESEVYLANTGKSEMDDARQKRKNATDLLRRAIENIIGAAPSSSDLDHRAQGVHYADLPIQAKLKDYCYFVNGKNIFRGQYGDNDGDITWTIVNNVVDCGVVFDNPTRASEWSFVKDVSDLEAASQVDHTKLYWRIRKILDVWKFAEHEPITAYLAAYIMSMPVMAAIGPVNITAITGAPESGKTSLIMGLLGGKYSRSHPVPTIMEAAMLTGDASSAAVYQKWDVSALACILDEAESGPGRHTQHDKRNKELLRQMYNLPMGGVLIDRGGITKDGLTHYHLRMPFLMAAINMPTDPVLLTRMFIIYTDKDEARKPPAVAIGDMFSMDELECIRHDVTIGLIPYIPKLIRIRSKLERTLPGIAKERGLPHNSNRFMDGLLTPLAVYEFVGEDATELYMVLLDKYKNRLDDVSKQSKRSDVIDTCLFNPVVKVAGADNVVDYVAAKDLIIRNEISILNNSNAGVYYIHSDHLIVIVWRVAKFGVLNRTQFCHENVPGLRESASKLGTGFVIPEVSKELDTKIRQYLNMADVRGPSDYTVLNGSYLFDLAQESCASAKTSKRKAQQSLAEQMVGPECGENVEGFVI